MPTNRHWLPRIFAACFIAYTAAYLCRVNYAVALPAIQASLGLSSASVGLIGTAFFWSYALGQLVNGYLGDRVSARGFIFFGLIASVVINVAFGFTTALWAMVLLWAANGIFQSMLWGPLVKTLAHWFPNRQLNRVAFGMSLTMIFGYLIAWGMSGAMVNAFSWPWAFWLPAAIVTGLAFVWLGMARNRPRDVGLADTASASTVESASPASTPTSAATAGDRLTLWQLIRSTGLLPIAVTAATQGIIRDSILLWAPKLLMDTQGLSLKSAVGVVLIIPLVNFSGIALANWLHNRLGGREKHTLLYLMLATIVTSLGLAFFVRVNIGLTVALLAISTALMYGANPLITTVIPFNYAYCDRVSGVAGFLDCAIYVGSGVAGVLTGLIIDALGWNSVFVLWAAAAAVGAACMWVSMRRGQGEPTTSRG